MKCPRKCLAGVGGAFLRPTETQTLSSSERAWQLTWRHDQRGQSVCSGGLDWQGRIIQSGAEHERQLHVTEAV